MKGMSKRVSLKEKEVIQIHIFPNEEGARHTSCKKRQCALVKATGFAVACHWNASEPKEFCGSGAEYHCLGPVPTGIKEA